MSAKTKKLIGVIVGVVYAVVNGIVIYKLGELTPMIIGIESIVTFALLQLGINWDTKA